jgi:hypothetical protein
MPVGQIKTERSQVNAWAMTVGGHRPPLQPLLEVFLEFIGMSE